MDYTKQTANKPFHVLIMLFFICLLGQKRQQIYVVEVSGIATFLSLAALHGCGDWRVETLSMAWRCIKC
jgi:hypothetical protein